VAQEKKKRGNEKKHKKVITNNEAQEKEKKINNVETFKKGKRNGIRTRRARNRRWHLNVPDLAAMYPGCFSWLPCCAVVISDYFGTNSSAVSVLPC
jgi:hypothetical protein